MCSFKSTAGSKEIYEEVSQKIEQKDRDIENRQEKKSPKDSNCKKEEFQRNKGSVRNKTTTCPKEKHIPIPRLKRVISTQGWGQKQIPHLLLCIVVKFQNTRSKTKTRETKLWEQREDFKNIPGHF